MNLATLTSQAAIFCSDPDQTRFGTKYTNAANRAQEQFALDTRSLWKDTTFVAVSGTSTYALPSDFMFEDQVTFNGMALKPISRFILQIQAPNRDWTLDSGTPLKYIIDPEEAQKKLVMYPNPGANDAGLTISMRYFPFPAALASGTDIPLNSSLLMTQFHMAIAAYQAWLVLMGETVTPEIDAKQSKLLRIYNDGVEKAIETFKNTASEPLRLRGTNPR